MFESCISQSHRQQQLHCLCIKPYCIDFSRAHYQSNKHEKSKAGRILLLCSLFIHELGYDVWFSWFTSLFDHSVAILCQSVKTQCLIFHKCWPTSPPFPGPNHLPGHTAAGNTFPFLPMTSSGEPMQERTTAQLHLEKRSILSPSDQGKPNSSPILLLQAAVHKLIEAQGGGYTLSSMPCPQIGGATLLASLLQAAGSVLPPSKVRNTSCSLCNPLPS